MPNNRILDQKTTDETGNYPAVPANALYEGTLHVRGVWNGARIVVSYAVGTPLRVGTGVTFDASNTAARYIKVNLDQLQAVILGGDADTKLDLDFSGESVTP